MDWWIYCTGNRYIHVTNSKYNKKNPRIWIPPILTSAILGPISTTLFKMESNMIGAGMGTSGLVGQFAVIEVMGSNPRTFITILLLHLILPGVISF